GRVGAEVVARTPALVDQHDLLAVRRDQGHEEVRGPRVAEADSDVDIDDPGVGADVDGELDGAAAGDGPGQVRRAVGHDVGPGPQHDVGGRQREVVAPRRVG